LAPEYATAAQELAKDEPPVKIAKVDATVETELGQRFGVRGYPTLKIFRNGKESEYDWPRDAPGIIKYIRSKTAPASRLIENSEAEKKFREGGSENPHNEWRSTVIFYGPSSSPIFPLYTALSNAFREDAKFGHVHDESVLKSLGHSADSSHVTIHLPPRYDSKLEKLSNSLSHKNSEAADDSIKQKLMNFFFKHVLPLGGEFSNDNNKLYKERGLPIVKVYSTLDWQRDPKGANYQLNRLRKIAKDFADKLSFVVTSKKNSAAELKDLDIPNIDVPFIIHDLKTDLKYRHDTPEFNPEAVKSFIEDFLAGKVESYMKSEKVPETNDDPVKVVVGRTFNDIVMDPTKDVLIEAYAPWCGHCKSLEPKYKELAEKMSKYSDSLVIAKIDATANSLPPAFAAKGYPTIFFAKANNKENPMKYEGAREVEDFVNFIKKEASLPLVAKGGEE